MVKALTIYEKLFFTGVYKKGNRYEIPTWKEQNTKMEVKAIRIFVKILIISMSAQKFQ